MGKQHPVVAVLVGSLRKASINRRLAQPEAFVRYREGLIAEDGSVRDASVDKFLGKFVDSHLAWASRFVQPGGRRQNTFLAAAVVCGLQSRRSRRDGEQACSRGERSAVRWPPVGAAGRLRPACW